MERWISFSTNETEIDLKRMVSKIDNSFGVNVIKPKEGIEIGNPFIFAVEGEFDIPETVEVFVSGGTIFAPLNTNVCRAIKGTLDLGKIPVSTQHHTKMPDQVAILKASKT